MLRMLRRRRSSAASHSPARSAARRDAGAVIAALTATNRARRDRDVERQLVQLRFDAFAQTAWPTETPPAPPVADLFADDGIPEIRGHELSVERVRSAIQHHGSVLVRGLVDPDQVARLVSDIDSAFDAYDAWAAGEPNAVVDGWYVPTPMHNVNDGNRADKRRNGAILAVESPPTLFDLIEIFDDVGVGQLARDYLGEPPAILARKVTLRRMAPKLSGAWHQDGAFMGRDLRALNVWLALTRCGEDASSLDVVARRLDDIVPPGGASKPYAVAAETAERVGAGAIVRPVFDPGDALIFDHMLLHRTGRDPGMTKTRYAIETWFMAPSSYAAMAEGRRRDARIDDQVPLVY
jgi:Phytanoyl-CoA dioxygenase (PhyH)